jgi:succinate dehydrogenase / fumarate reductase flavoprotein subunit
MQDVMQRLVGIFRVDADLQEAIAELAKLRARLPALAVSGGRVFNPGWNLCFELRNLLVVSEAITRSALQRTESRGAHSRLDFPDTDQAGWGGRNGVVRRRPDGSMEVATTKLPEMTDELGALLGGGH